ncbi:MAG TPA: hypothetical protein PKL10_18665, partial [Nitrospira sp.]|nr:hypothetical protein [Nitrospira sp.]
MAFVAPSPILLAHKSHLVVRKCVVAAGAFLVLSSGRAASRAGLSVGEEEALALLAPSPIYLPHFPTLAHVQITIFALYNYLPNAIALAGREIACPAM